MLLPGLLAAQDRVDLAGSISLFEREIIFPVDSLSHSFNLGDSLLIPASEKIWADTLLLVRDQDYSIEYLIGNVELKRPVSNAKHVRIRYRIFPFGLKQRYRNRAIVMAEPSNNNSDSKNGSSEVLRPRPSLNSNSQQRFGSQLRKNGSILRGISVGTNQNLQVDSGLRMQVSGKLAQNVDVVASLTDLNTPIQPEGNTQTLQEIDKVFVQIKAPNLEATLGDYNLSLAGTEFTQYNRKLQGVMGRAKIHNTSVTVSGAVSRGQFNTNEFLGQEGNQGPYQLQGPNGEINLIVLAGTERVWVDGEVMTRGENQDYTIDYGNGQITFTRHRLISSDSRITVDFQFSDESFEREFVAARGQTRLFNDKIRFGATFIRESDDKNNPLSVQLDESRLAVLEEAGDGDAIVPGWTRVPQDSGTYILDSTGVFIYVGPGNGDHNVSFSFFGTNHGDYRNIGLGRYEFVGENLGSYRPFLILPKAQRHDMLGLNLEVSPISAFQIRSEIAVSDFDANVYSLTDNNDNQGTAYTINFALTPSEISLGGKNLGKLELTGKVRNKAATFRDIDRTTIAEFNRRWNIGNLNSSVSESISEFQGRYLPITGLSLHAGIGKLSKSSDFKSNRWEIGATLDKKFLPKSRYFVEFIDKNDERVSEQSTWLRQRASAEYDLKKIKPIFEYEGEIRKDTRVDSMNSGFRFDSYTGGLKVMPWRSLQASVRYTVRDDKNRQNETFLPKSIARTQSYNLSLNNWHALSMNASYTHRQRDFSDQTLQDTRTDLADIQVRFSPRNGGVRGNVYYQASNTQVARQEEVFIPVKEGDGNFSFNEELNEFEPDPFGDHVRRLFTTKDFIPVIGLKIRADFRLTPGRYFESANKDIWAKVLSPFSSETFIRVDERTKEDNVAKIYLLDLSRFRQDSTTIFGSLEIRQDIYLWEKSRIFSLRYRFRNRDEMNNQLVDGGQRREVREHGLRILNRFSERISSQIEFAHSREDRIFDSISRQDRKIRSDALQLDLVYRPNRQLELALKSELSFNKDIVLNPNTEARLISFKPRSSYSLSNKGRLRAEIEWSQVDVSPIDRLIPFELTDGRRAGTTLRWNFGFDYRLSRNVQASMTYFGRNEPGRAKTQHIARVEMRAFF